MRKKPSPPAWYDAGMLRYLCIAVTALSLTACVLLVALWVRSYAWRDEVALLFDGNSKLALLQSHPGRLVVSLNHAGSDTFSRDFYSQIINTQRWTPPRGRAFRSLLPGIKAGIFSYDPYIELPYWLLICAGGTLATIRWLRWSRRFGLRTLLIATTLVAVVLGVVVLSLWVGLVLAQRGILAVNLKPPLTTKGVYNAHVTTRLGVFCRHRNRRTNVWLRQPSYKRRIRESCGRFAS